MAGSRGQICDSALSLRCTDGTWPHWGLDSCCSPISASTSHQAGVPSLCEKMETEPGGSCPAWSVRVHWTVTALRGCSALRLVRNPPENWLEVPLRGRWLEHAAPSATPGFTGAVLQAGSVSLPCLLEPDGPSLAIWFPEGGKDRVRPLHTLRS